MDATLTLHELKLKFEQTYAYSVFKSTINRAAKCFPSAFKQAAYCRLSEIQKQMLLHGKNIPSGIEVRAILYGVMIPYYWMS